MSLGEKELDRFKSKLEKFDYEIHKIIGKINQLMEELVEDKFSQSETSKSEENKWVCMIKKLKY